DTTLCFPPMVTCVNVRLISSRTAISSSLNTSPELISFSAPTDYKADWNDYHQQHGLAAATAAFKDSMYQPRGKGAQVKNHK
ncbi:hypothetical protein QS594_26015, partial [Escherichia coli]|uniref:hypothetical protein n=1 Tax=Escherichia coli TaxID=562 RepID=UPI00157A5160